jgi:hypothetical protein
VATTLDRVDHHASRVDRVAAAHSNLGFGAARLAPSAVRDDHLSARRDARALGVGLVRVLVSARLERFSFGWRLGGQRVGLAGRFACSSGAPKQGGDLWNCGPEPVQVRSNEFGDDHRAGGAGRAARLAGAIGAARIQRLANHARTDDSAARDCPAGTDHHVNHLGVARLELGQRRIAAVVSF